MAVNRCFGILFACAVGIGTALVTAVAPAQAKGMYVGTNLGFTHYSPEGGDGVSVFALPSQSVLLVTFQPGLRIGGFVDDAGQQEIYVDTGLWLVSDSGSSINGFQLMLAYQMAFSPGVTSPFINLGGGLLHLGGDVQSINSPVIGAGLGVRHTLAHGHGAVRGEIRFDRQFEAKDDNVVVLEAMSNIGVRVGFDVYLR